MFYQGKTVQEKTLQCRATAILTVIDFPNAHILLTSLLSCFVFFFQDMLSSVLQLSYFLTWNAVWINTLAQWDLK